MGGGAKRQRVVVDCDGTECGKHECSSCAYQNPGASSSSSKVPASSALPQQTTPSFKNMVSELSETAIRGLLIDLAATSPSAQSAIKNAYSLHLERESRPVDFDRYSKQAWHVLNTSSYSKLRSSKQYECAGDAFNEVMACVKAIDKGTKSTSAFATKQSALETLRKITKTLLLVDDTLGHEIRKELQWDESIPEVMLRILYTMTEEEISRSGNSTDEKGSLIDKIAWTAEEASSYGLDGLNGLNEVLAILKGDYGEEEEEGEGEGDEYDEHGEYDEYDEEEEEYV